ncbi:hypothetical protein SLS58_008962 [Diplodia intermedia]|uniref:Hydrophobin n=1 Tax=Diplodia intermedia TaxID=856260 RepID=A0ABR3TF23_9PEZI
MKTTPTSATATATALLATLLLTHLAAPAPAPAPIADASSPAPPAYQHTDANNDAVTNADWKEPQGWAPPAHFDWSVLAKSRPAAGPKYGGGGAGYRHKRRKAGGGGAGYGDESHDDNDGYESDGDGYESDDDDDDNGGATGTAQVCSGNSNSNNVASCLSGLLNVGGIGALTDSGCQAQQQVSCCEQNGGGLLNIQSCGPLIDIL